MEMEEKVAPQGRDNAKRSLSNGLRPSSSGELADGGV